MSTKEDGSPAPFPSLTQKWHTKTYPSIDPAKPSLSTAGKTIVITGGGAGIGAGFTEAFAKSGAANIAIIGRTESTLLEMKKSVESKYPTKISTYVADITDEENVNKALDAIKKEIGPVDVMVNNAGTLPDFANIKDLSLVDTRNGYEINVIGTIIVAQAFLRNAAEKGAVLIHLTSGAAHIPPSARMSTYQNTKLVSAKFIEHVGAENPNIRVINMHPGVIMTDMQKKSHSFGYALPEDEISLPSSFVVWCASPESAFANGKFLWCNWDVDELIARKDEISAGDFLTIGLKGWPENCLN